MEVYIKNNVSLHEYQMHKYIYELEIVNVPKIVAYDFERKVLVMEKIKNISISDFYGENSENINPEIFIKVRSIINKLLESNIEYPDITGYNFIECNDKIWIIDFEHSSVITIKKIDPFITKFINGLNKWNPNFK
jgi:tRNA A-37 threonylcarbamoyl transferase component Bud32